MEYGLIGNPLRHSFSPAVHQKIGAYSYALQELKEEELAPFFAARAFRGINVTIPYKSAVIPYLDEISPAAAKIGAVNTVVNAGGKLIGYNTDFDGLLYLFSLFPVSPKGKKVLLLGTGGTSKTARAALQVLGAGEIVTVSRHPSGDAISYEEAPTHADCAFIVNTTPVGMFPHQGESPLSLSAFPSLCGVLDVICNPLRSSLVLSAREKGVFALGGLPMLVCQALAAARLFGTANDTAQESTLVDECRRLRENIVLIGMPASGKSTVGRAVAAALSRPFFDSDAVFQEEYGLSAGAYIAQYGEDAFREKEAAVLASLAEKTGAVIATGGGSLCKEESRTRLRHNGRLYFLDRDVLSLRPSADRPLSQTKEALRALYEKRLPLYLSACDCRVAAKDGDIAGTVAAVITDFTSPHSL